jgi:hypothetical protein
VIALSLGEYFAVLILAGVPKGIAFLSGAIYGELLDRVRRHPRVSSASYAIGLLSLDAALGIAVAVLAFT